MRNLPVVSQTAETATLKAMSAKVEVLAGRLEAAPAKPGAAAQVKRCIAEEAQDLRRRNAVLVTENAELQARVAMLERVVERSEGTGPLSAARDPGGKWYGYAYTREGARGPEAPAAAPAAGQRSEARRPGAQAAPTTP